MFRPSPGALNFQIRAEATKLGTILVKSQLNAEISLVVFEVRIICFLLVINVVASISETSLL